MSNNKLGEASQAARAMLLNAQPRIEAINNPKNAAPTWLVSASMLMGAYAAGNTGYLPARFEQHFAKFAVETAEVNTAAKEKIAAAYQAPTPQPAKPYRLRSQTIKFDL